MSSGLLNDFFPVFRLCRLKWVYRDVFETGFSLKYFTTFIGKILRLFEFLLKFDIVQSPVFLDVPTEQLDSVFKNVFFGENLAPVCNDTLR